LETGFLIDNYEVLRPGMMRHSAPHYHAILKQAGFEIENGGSEYVVPLAGNSALFFEGNLDRASGRGYRIATLASLSADQRVADVSKTWNVVFSSHWGLAPMTQLEIDTLLHNPVSGDILTLSALAYSDNNPVGIVLAATEKSWRRGMFFASRYSVQSLNSFAVGVCETHRGCGIATALASHSYLALIARGAKLLSYGLILADNLASRAAALKLGARCSSNYVTYCARPL
jgi:GNAT superfamily N-acetyltransferase